MASSIKYPRRKFIRGLIRGVVRGLVNLLTRPEISALVNFPDSGPLIVVANHTGAMEVILMGIFSPKPMEFFAAMEMPWNDWMGKIIKLYGIIPVYRGYASPSTMKSGLEVLSQGAILGIFPEGGYWEPGNKQARNGAAWLSYQSGAPVLPIGFGDTRGLMADALHLKFPRLVMNVGEVMPPVAIDPSLPKKLSLARSADEIMGAVWDLVPEEERRRKEQQPKDEAFSLKLRILDRAANPVQLPDELALSEGAWISRFIHRPNLIDMIRDYVFPEIQVLKEFHKRPPVDSIRNAVSLLLAYVADENPQYFKYRYGVKDGAAFQESFQQLLELLDWVEENGYSLEAEAIYEFTDPVSGEQKRILVPDSVEHW